MRKYVLLITFHLGFFYLVFSQNSIADNPSHRFFYTGEYLMIHENYAAAQRQFQDFLDVASSEDLRRPWATYYEILSGLHLSQPNAEKNIRLLETQYAQSLRLSMIYCDAANVLFNDKKYVEAADYYAKVDFSMLSGDQYVKGRFQWGYSLFSQKRMKEAWEQFNLIKLLNSRYTPAANYYAGYTAWYYDSLDMALTDLKRTEQSDAYAHVVPYMIANIYYKQRQYGELQSYIKPLMSMENLVKKDEIMLLSAETFYQQESYALALEGYEMYINEHSGKMPEGVYFKAGLSAYQLGYYDKALTFLRKEAAVNERQQGGYASYYLGVIYLMRHKPQLAYTAFANAQKFVRDSLLAEESTFKKAKILYDISNYGAAVDELNQFIKQYKYGNYLDEAKTLLSQAYLNASNYDQAIEHIERMSQRTNIVNETYQKATFFKGVELFNKNLYGQAILFFKKSLKYPVDKRYVIKASFWQGEAYAIQDKYDQAIELYLKVVALQKNVPATTMKKTRYGLGYAFYNLELYDRALFNFRDFVTDHANKDAYYFDGMLRLADCYHVKKMYPQALQNYERVIQAQGQDRDYALLQAGVILGIQQKYKEADTLLTMVLNQYPHSHFLDEAIFQKAQLQFEQSNYKYAVTHYSAFIKAHPSSKLIPYAYLRRAASYYNLKKYDKAIADYVMLLDHYTTHFAAKQALLPLQELLNLQGNIEVFEDHLTSFKKANPDAEDIASIEFEAAKNLYFHQSYQEAIKRFANYIRDYQDSPHIMEAQYYQAESYYRTRNYTKSLAMHRKLSHYTSFLLFNKVVTRVGELEYKLKNYDSARMAYTTMARVATTKKEKLRAWLGLMESYFMLASYDSSDRYAQHILENGKTSIGAQNKASLFLGKSSLQRKDYEIAKDELISTINIARDEYGAEAKYLLGQVFFLTKDYKQCYETLIGLNAEYTPYTYWVGRSYLLLSDNFIALQDIFQAKATLNSLVEDFPLEIIRKEARKKLAMLNSLSDVHRDSIDNDVVIDKK